MTQYEEKKLFVRNVDRWASDQDLKDFFSQFGEVVSVFIPKKPGRDGALLSKGYAFVEFATNEAAQEAQKATDGADYRGRPLGVSFSEVRERTPRYGGSRNYDN